MHFGRFILAMMNLTLNEYGQNRKSNGTWKKLKKQAMTMKYDKLTDVFSAWADLPQERVCLVGRNMTKLSVKDTVPTLTLNRTCLMSSVGNGKCSGRCLLLKK